MPFGLCNAPATFQRLMQKLGLNGALVLFMDDILVASHSFDEHLQHLREVAGLRLKPRKCNLLWNEVPFLGHISTEGLQPDPVEIEKVQ